MKSIAKKLNFNFFLLVSSFSFLNLYVNRVNSETMKNITIDQIDFETALNQNSVQFHKYESQKNLFDDFFGLGDPLNESSDNTHFQDLSLQIDSKNLRELYKEKLLEMKKKNKKNDDNKLNWSFFSKRI